jgi:hypothetical protein
MKSAYELAMERLDKQHGKVAAVSPAQKKAISDIDQRAKAKKAETEILFSDQIKEARMKGDGESVRRIEAELTTEISRIRDRAEDEKEAVRRDARLA